jgi:hypothetical protein
VESPLFFDNYICITIGCRRGRQTDRKRQKQREKEKQSYKVEVEREKWDEIAK